MSDLYFQKSCRKFMSVFFFLAISLFIISIAPLYAVSEAGLLFLLISPSPQANGMGQTYGTLAGEEPMASIFNPASLGLFARNHFVGASFYPEKAPWLPQLGGLTYNSHALNFGLNLKEITGLPVSAGLGLGRVYLDYGKQSFVSLEGLEPYVTMHAYDRANIVSIAASVDYYLLFSAGFNYKWIESQLGYDFRKNTANKANVNAYDLGIIVRAPLVKIAAKLWDKPAIRFRDVVPYLTPGFYYAMTNIGDKISYMEGMADPLPRNLSMGFHFLAGFKYESRHGAFNLYSFKWAREADDMLVSRSKNGNWRYLSPTDDINFGNNILLGKSNDKIITKTGWEYNIGDFVFIRRGKYQDVSGRVVFSTKGWGASLLQPLRIMDVFHVINADNIAIKILTHLNVIYNETEVQSSDYHFFSNPGKGIIVRLENFPL